MSRGLMRLKILNSTIYPDWRYQSNNVLILKNDAQISEIALNGINTEEIWMEYLSDSLEVTLTNKNDPYSQEFGYADIRVSEMIKYQNTLHKINVYISIKDKRKGWIEKDAALVILELYYSRQPMWNGNLNLMIIDADLIRDTEVVGKMDPYVVIRTARGDFKTSVKNNAGKKPIWNQTFPIPITSINQKIDLIVYDKDVMTDDEVGKCSFTIRELGFSQRQRAINLFYMKKNGSMAEPAGILRIKAALN